MRKLTNKFNIPKAIFRAIENDPYTKGEADFSITELIKPSQIVQLESVYGDQIEEDVTERIWSLFGQVAHGILERAGDQTLELVEKRMFMKIGQTTISGQIDTLSFEDGILSDFKVATVWKFLADKDIPPEYEQQLNMQNLLLRENGHVATSLQIVGILRDWSKREADRRASYPPLQVAIMPIPMWSKEKTLEFMTERILSHQRALGGLRVPCTAEEHWNWKRCQSYCSVSKWCRQYNLKREDNAATGQA